MRVRSIAVALFAVSTIALSGCASGATSESASSSSAVASTSANAEAEAPTEGGGAVGESSANPTGGEGVGGPSAKPTSDNSGNSAGGADASCPDVSLDLAFETTLEHLPRPSYDSPDIRWTTVGADTSGFDTCAELSWIILPMHGGTASSPYAVVLYHKGAFLGSATHEFYPFFPEVARVDDATISVTYSYLAPEDANASPSLRATSIFTYEGDGPFTRSGDLPPS